jgi:hypothetical protein
MRTDAPDQPMTEERLREIEARAGSALPGHSEHRVGPITLGCITIEARDLIDEAYAAWVMHREDMRIKQPRHHISDEAYAVLYWLIRWSGLVNPAARQDIPALLREVARLKGEVERLRGEGYPFPLDR